MLDPDHELRRIIELDKQMRDLDPLRNDPTLRSAEEMRKLMEPIEKLNASLKPIEGALRDAAGSSHMTDIVRSSVDVRPFPAHFQELARAQAEAAEAPTARRAVMRIEHEVREFEASLDDKSEVGIRLVSFGQNAVVHIETVDYWQPNLIVFAGHLDENGSPVRLIQHLSQLSFLLVKLPRLEPDKPRRPIGFTTREEDTEGSK